MGTLKVLQPQEVEVFYLLPTLRKEIAKALKTHGHDQKRIAAMLGVTDAAVSQYITGKRGSEVEFPKEFTQRVAEAAKTILDQQSCFTQLQQLMQEATTSGLLCQIHMQMDKSVGTSCAVCFERK